MYNIDIRDEAEDWLSNSSTLIEDTIENVRAMTGEPDNLHEDVDSFDDSHNRDAAFDDAVDAVADALHDDIAQMIHDYLERHNRGFIADAVQDAVEAQYERWYQDAEDESKSIREDEAEDEDDQ
jgi:hypothetical protein